MRGSATPTRVVCCRITLRHTPSVFGDGLRDVRALIGADRRLQGHAARFESSLKPEALSRVPAVGEQQLLTTVASLRVGARYEDIGWCATEILQAKLDEIARSMDRFHWGRFDVRFGSMADLSDGKFQIIEVNGAGAEAINNWDPTIPMTTAFKGVFAKQVHLFELAAAMRRRGNIPIGIIGLARAWLRQHRMIKQYPISN